MYRSVRNLVLILLALGITASYSAKVEAAYIENNEFIPDAFPGEVSSEIFSIPLDPNQLIVVYPRAMEPEVKNLRSILAKKTGKDIQFRLADDLTERDFNSKHLVVIGNISNNKWTLALYKRRHAFADAYFPGSGGVSIHPATSPWDIDKNILVIGVSTDEDLRTGFTTFVDMLDEGAETIETIRHLRTSLLFPSPPETVKPQLDRVRQDWRFTDAPYPNIAQWGLSYALTGDKKWAEHFRDGMYLLYERAEATGLWIPVDWTMAYFNLMWHFLGWELIGHDPFFTMQDRKIIEEVLWGMSYFSRGRPYLDEGNISPREPQQNHPTFLGLTLYHAHRYYTEKYGLPGWETEVEKIGRVFNDGQIHSYYANDDGGGYQLLAPFHTIYHSLAEGDDSFFESGNLKKLVDQLIATTDNRLSAVAFGDVSSYSEIRHDGDPETFTRNFARRGEVKFLEMAAWYYRDGRYKWLSDWMSKYSRFNFAEMYGGAYAVDIKPEEPKGFTGIVPVLLDEGALRFSSRSSEKKSHYPLAGEKYFNKLVFRPSFDREDEYLLLDGTSTFAHGHLDGNTVLRLTWKDRIWLFEIDYIKATPRYHNGVIVVCDGVQDIPPPLNTLDYAGEFDSIGMTRTTSKDYNGADWERNIVWKKGEYFLFLDKVTALKAADFRLENNWRTRGEVDLSGNVFSVHQGGKSFYIKSADNASRTIRVEPEGYRNTWNYPWGEPEIHVCFARKNIPLEKNSSWIFANLMYAVDDPSANQKEILKIRDGFYKVKDSKSLEYIGLDPDLLSEEKIYTDCGIFFVNSTNLVLMDASYLKFRNVSFESSAKVHLEIDTKKSTGIMIVPEGSKGKFKVQNLTFRNTSTKNGIWLDIEPGTYSFSFRGGVWRNKAPFGELSIAARTEFPEMIDNHIINFGIEQLKEFDAPAQITSMSSDGKNLITGDSNGHVIRYDGDSSNSFFRISSGLPIVALHAADVTGDGKNELIAGDDDESIYCIDTQGKQLWTNKLIPFTRYQANAVDITTGDIDNSGKQAILVSSTAWKLFAFEPDGELRWESFIYYHPLTKVKIFETESGKNHLAVGTTYSTPLNVVDPVDGKVIWHTWQQVGSESMSTTEFCGIHLTDMVFVDTDNNGRKDIVFGTQFNWVCALDADNGDMKWKIAVGDEVTVMEVMDDPLTGEKRILVATEAGELYMLDRTGKRLNMITFGSGISDMKILDYPDRERIDIMISTRDGRIIICDNEFIVRASHALEKAPLKGIVMSEEVGNAKRFFCVSETKVHFIEYRPSFKRMSRQF